MALKTFRPQTASLRGLVQIDRSGLWKGRPKKGLTKGLVGAVGRNNYGRITCRHKSAGHKKLYRIIDFKRAIRDIPATVERIEYDPNRTAFIALLKYENAKFSYILAPEGLKVGDSVIAGVNADIKPGNALPLKSIPIGITIHNIELRPSGGGKMIRSAGGFAQLVGKDSGYALIKLRSGELRRVLDECYATVGSLSNADHQNTTIGKAGRSRWLGIRPTVRGVAMNPVDHPHGGGEGKTSGGRHPVTPWGKPTKGKKTRKNKRTNKFIISRRGSKQNG